MRDAPLAALEGAATGEWLAVGREGRGEGGAEAGAELVVIAPPRADDEAGDKRGQGDEADCRPSPTDRGWLSAVARWHASRLARRVITVPLGLPLARRCSRVSVAPYPAADGTRADAEAGNTTILSREDRRRMVRTSLPCDMGVP